MQPILASLLPEAVSVAGGRAQDISGDLYPYPQPAAQNLR
jgi:hypothetical protein